jgi:hypothetical protein
MRTKFFLSTSLFVLLGTTSSAQSNFPGPLGSDPWEHRPNDPGYSDMWQLFSHIPKDHRGDVNVSEQRWGSGMHVDRAWQLHTGTPQMVVAILDSGINWDNNDLLERHFLNIKELPLPEGSQTYDKNGDGRVSISDYRGDSRVYDANNNGASDAGDLIKIFSNGIDEDFNGYTDDIGGWDFHEHDNDPSDRTKFGHGTGEARDSVAAINNGISGAGVCGNCTFIALRLNDSFIVDSNAFAQAVIYAVDIGAGLVQQALGGVNHSELTKEAVNYAYDRNVVIIGSAADENSFHHNYPSTLDPVVYTNAIRYDTREFKDATTFLNFNNCSNYGARVDVATSGRSCSSEATGNLSGISALALSYGKSIGKNLTAGQLISLIKTSANDINFGPQGPDSERHSTFEGWDTITGYGRTNAYTMLQRIKDNQIPPEARILAPEWFAFERYDQNANIKITALARDVRDVTIDIYRGVETALQAKVSSNKITATVTGNKRNEYSAVISHRTLASLTVHPEEPERYHDAYTAVLTTTGLNGIKAEARRTFFVHQDPALSQGFPQVLRGSGESSGLFVDLDQDGKDEYVTGDGSGYLHAFKMGGSELAGFPVAMPRSTYQGPTAVNFASIFAPIASGDIDNDGRADIVVATLEGQVIAVDHDGQIKPGFPVRTSAPNWNVVNKAEPLALGSMASPVIADLTGDGPSEIIVPSMDGKLYVFNANGTNTNGFPMKILAENKMARLMSSPAIYDIDQDGIKDFILGSNHTADATGYLFAISGLGTRVKAPFINGFPARVPLIKDAVLPTVGTGIPTSPAITDFDGDGVPEILIHAFVGKPYLFGMDGRIKKSLSIRVSDQHETNDEFVLAAFGHPAPIDILGRGYPQPTTVGVGQRMLVSLLLGGKRLDYNHMMGAWDAISGEMISGYPKSHDDMILAGSAVAIDTNNNGRMEMAVGSGGYYLRIKGADGVDKKHFTGGWIFGAPALGDIDGDGFVDIAATTREGNLFVWRTTARKSPTVPSQTWSTFKGNNQRTGTQL